MTKHEQDPRLLKILSIIDKMGIRFPIAEIQKRTGIHKGNVSSILNGKKPMSDNFYNIFLEKFPVNGDFKPAPKATEEEINVVFELIASNRILANAHIMMAEAQRDLSSSNKMLADGNIKLINLLKTYGL